MSMQSPSAKLAGDQKVKPSETRPKKTAGLAAGLNPRIKDMRGRRFNRLLVLDQPPLVRNRHAAWTCLCDCGKTKVILASDLLRKDRPTGSCGCLHREVAASNLRNISTTHGMSLTPEYGVWSAMIDRCENANHRQFRHYGGRGITVCKSWRHSFQLFLVDMGRRPSSKHSIDRYPDNDGNYEPGNCRWATAIEQANNTRSNKFVQVNGRLVTVAQGARELGLQDGTFRKRLSRGNFSSKAIRSAPAL